MNHTINMFAVIATLIVGAPASAQRYKSDLKFNEVKLVPASVKKQSPSGFITAQYGISSIDQSGGRVALHLYSLPARKASKQKLKSFRLDLFTPTRNGLNRINSVDLPAGTSARIARHISTPIAWLNVKQRKGPIIPVLVYQDEPETVEWGGCFLLVFANGLKNKPTIQKFECGYTGDSVSLSLYYYGIDERGFIILNHQIAQPTGTGESSNLTDELYYWNGKQFVARR